MIFKHGRGKERLIGFSTYRSFTERFLKHKTDIKAMNRADEDYFSTTEEGFDYEDDEMDELEENAQYETFLKEEAKAEAKAKKKKN
ncbi:MAG: hypothetical protein K6G83_03385 [Lachnospiraceae bacterium]|nr:hypothetical protein [Lachnospiraceae bacterium]